jgi:hypothetical protein
VLQQSVRYRNEGQLWVYSDYPKGLQEHDTRQWTSNLLVDGWLTFQESLTRTVLDELPKDFLVDIWMQKERNGHKKNGCEISFGCDYHEHFSEEEKKDCVVRVEVLI